MNNQLIKIDLSNADRPTVLGRDLHEALEVRTAYKDWFPRMCEYGFTEGKDFNPLKNERVALEGGRQVKRVLDDHQITIAMAKELCMIQRTEKGKQFRQYFIQIEEAWNSPEQVIARGLMAAQRMIEQKDARIKQLTPKAEYADNCLIAANGITTSSIAKEYGISAAKLNGVLKGLKIQFKQGEQWLLYSKYQDKGYTVTKTIPITRRDGRPEVRRETLWTMAGRKFIYDKLAGIGMYPQPKMPELGENVADKNILQEV